MKKIAILAPYVGTINRGAETFVIELTKQLSEWYEVDVYALKNEPAINANICAVNVNKSSFFRIHEKLYTNNVIYRKIVNKFYYLIPDVIFQRKFTRKAFNKIRNTKYDLLFPNNGVWGARLSAKLRKEKNIPFIYTGHGGIGIGEKYILGTRPNAYICLTNKHLVWANELKSQFTKTMVIPNGVNVFDFIIRKSNAHTFKTILSVAALTEFKRHYLTIEAISKVKDVKLVILGKGEEEKRLIELAENKIPGRYTITSVPYSEMKKMYAEADLFVLPSLEEPFGIVYLEAMAANVPIVAPDDSQRREIIGDAGLYCDVENKDEYSAAIQQAISIDWKDKPRKRATMFDWSVVSDKYKKLIDEVIEESE